MRPTPVERRLRIRDLTFGGSRWVAALVAVDGGEGIWRGRVVFFHEGHDSDPQLEDVLGFEGLAFEELLAQARALSPEALQRRLERALGVGA